MLKGCCTPTPRFKLVMGGSLTCNKLSIQPYNQQRLDLRCLEIEKSVHWEQSWELFAKYKVTDDKTTASSVSIIVKRKELARTARLFPGAGTQAPLGPLIQLQP
jgi:hypothetical protein